MTDPDYELLSLLQRFEEQGPLDATWLSLAEALLGFIRVRQASPEIWDVEAGEPEDSIVRLTALFDAEIEALFSSDDGQRTSTFAAAATREQLTRIVRRLVEDESRGWTDYRGGHALFTLAIARALCNVIDDRMHETFREAFQADGVLRITEGAAYPVFSRDVRKWTGALKTNSHPASLPARDLTRLRHLRLGPPAEGIDYFLDFESWNRLSPLGRSDSVVFGIAQPNLRLDEFDIDLPETSSTFTNRGPKDSAEQARRFLNVVDAAGRRGVDVLLMPECTLDDDARDLVMAGYEAVPRWPSLVVTGLTTPSDNGEHFNQGWMVVSSESPSRPHQVETPPKLHRAKFGARTERIRVGTSVRLYVSDQWSIAVLICRDAMDQGLLDRLAEMGVNLVLVPAMTEKTSSMFDGLGTVRVRSQAFSLVASGPAHWANHGAPATARGERHEAFVGGPYAGWPEALMALPTDGPAPGEDSRGLWIVPSNTLAAEWVDVDEVI